MTKVFEFPEGNKIADRDDENHPCGICGPGHACLPDIEKRVFGRVGASVGSEIRAGTRHGVGIVGLLNGASPCEVGTSHEPSSFGFPDSINVEADRRVINDGAPNHLVGSVAANINRNSAFVNFVVIIDTGISIETVRLVANARVVRIEARRRPKEPVSRNATCGIKFML